MSQLKEDIVKRCEVHTAAHFYGRGKNMPAKMTVRTYYFGHGSKEAKEYGDKVLCVLEPREEIPYDFFRHHELGCECKEREERQRKDMAEGKEMQRQLEEADKQAEEEETPGSTPSKRRNRD